MAAAATSSSIFPLFSSLPRELRDQIWCGVLPNKIGRALYFYRKGYWCPWGLPETDEGRNPDDSETTLNIGFRHDLLNDIQFELPLLFVNREARSIASAWVREQHFEIRPRQNERYPILVRLFNPKHDALYITPDKWDDFHTEPFNRIGEPDLLGQTVNQSPDHMRIAIPEALFRNDVASIPEIFDWFALEVLFLIVNAQPEQQSTESDIKIRRLWEFASIQGGAVFGDCDRGGFDFGDSNYIGDKALYTELSEGLASNHIRSFEIRPVIAFEI